MNKSWKRTVLGIIGAITIIISQVSAVIDDDPKTSFDLETALGALALLGIGIAARDNNVSSEKAGAK